MRKLLVGFLGLMLFTGGFVSSASASGSYDKLIAEAKADYWKNGYVWSRYMQLYRPSYDYLNFSFRNFETDRLKMDANGVPMVMYYGKYEYNPVTVAQLALSKHGKYVRTNDEGILREFLALADGLMKMQSLDGAFRYSFTFKKPELDATFKPGWVSAMAQGEALSVFSRAYLLTQDRKYLVAGEKSLQFLMTPKAKGGVMTDLGDISANWKNHIWFEEYVTTKNNYTLNGYMFTLFGLYDWSQLVDFTDVGQAQADDAFKRGVASLKLILKKYDIGGFSTYDLSHLTMKKPPHIVPNYHAVHIYQLHALNTITKDQYFKDYSQKWIGYVEKVQPSSNMDAAVSTAVAQFKKTYSTYSNYASTNKVLVPEAAIHKEYNLSKKLFAETKTRLENSTSANKSALLASLTTEYNTYITGRVGPYIDAYTYATKRLQPKVASMEKAVAEGDLDTAESYYHQISRELRVGTSILHAFYGKEARDLMIQVYKRPAEALRGVYSKPVTVKMYYNQAEKLIEEGKLEEAKAAIEFVEPFVQEMTLHTKFDEQLLTKIEYVKGILAD